MDGMCLAVWLSPFQQQYTCCADELRADRRESERILYKAEATGGFLDLIQTHDNPLDISALGEELLDLLLGGVEGQVADIQRGGNLQGFLLQLPATLRAQRRTPRAQRARRAAATAPCPPAARLLARPCPGLVPPIPPRLGPATRRTRKCWSRYWLISQYESLLSPLSVVCSSPDMARTRPGPLPGPAAGILPEAPRTGRGERRARDAVPLRHRIGRSGCHSSRRAGRDRRMANRRRESSPGAQGQGACRARGAHAQCGGAAPAVPPLAELLLRGHGGAAGGGFGRCRGPWALPSRFSAGTGG